MDDESSQGNSRRGFLTGLGGLSVSTLGLWGTPGVSAQSGQGKWTDWPMAGYDPANTRTADFETVGGDRLRREWTARRGYFGRREAFSPTPTVPVVADGTVYTRSYLGLRAHDAASGRQQWLYDATLDTGPVVYDGRVFAYGDGNLHAVTRSGQRDWIRELDQVESLTLTPTPDGILYAGAGESTLTLGLIGYDGDTAWKRELEFPPEWVPVVRESRAYVGFSNGELRTIDLSSGEVLNRRSIGLSRSGSAVGSRLIWYDYSRIREVPLDDPGADPSTVYTADENVVGFAVTPNSNLLIAEKKNSVLRLRKEGPDAGSAASVPVGYGYETYVVATKSHAYVTHDRTITVIDHEEMAVTARLRRAGKWTALSPPAIANHSTDGAARTSLFVATPERLHAVTHTDAGRTSVYLDPAVESAGRRIDVGSPLANVAGVGVGAAATGSFGGVARLSAGRVRPSSDDGSDASSSSDEQIGDQPGDTDDDDGTGTDDDPVVNEPSGADTVPGEDVEIGSESLVPNLGDVDVRTLGYFLVFSWFGTSGLLLLAATLRWYPGILAGLGIPFDASGSMLFWRFAGTVTSVTAFANGAVGAVVVCRGFGLSERTQAIAAGATVLVGGVVLLFGQMIGLHYLLTYRYGALLGGAIVIAPALLVVGGGTLKYLFGAERVGYEPFFLALIGLAYLPVHGPWVATWTASVNFIALLVLLWHAVTALVATLGILVILAGVISGSRIRSAVGTEPGDLTGDASTEDAEETRGSRWLTSPYEMDSTQLGLELGLFWFVLAVGFEAAMALYFLGLIFTGSVLLVVLTAGAIVCGIWGVAALARTFQNRPAATKWGVWTYGVALCVSILAALIFILQSSRNYFYPSRLLPVASAVVPLMLLIVGLPLRYFFVKEDINWSTYVLGLLAPFYAVGHALLTSGFIFNTILDDIYYHATMASVMALGNLVMIPLSLLTIGISLWSRRRDDGGSTETPADDEADTQESSESGVTEEIESPDTDHSGAVEDAETATAGSSHSANDGEDIALENWGYTVQPDEPRIRAEASTTGQAEPDDEPTAASDTPGVKSDEVFDGTAPGVRNTRQRRTTEEGLDRFVGELDGVDGPVEGLAVPESAPPDVADAFGSRARIWRSLGGQENIVEILRVDDQPRPWLAHEPVDHLDQFSTVAREMDVEDVIFVVDSVAEALRVATLYNHNHHDLRPECVHIELDEGTCKVGDWGLVRTIEEASGDDRVTRFTAPEQLQSGDTTDLRTDVYAVGALAYFGATGTRPYVGATDLESTIPTTPFADANAMTDVPERLRDPIAQATALDPEDRFDTVAALQGAFRNVL